MTALSPVYNHFVNFLVEKTPLEDILAFEIPESARQRSIELLDKQDQGTLSSEEAEELQQMRQVDMLVSVLKAKALASTQHS